MHPMVHQNSYILVTGTRNFRSGVSPQIEKILKTTESFFEVTRAPLGVDVIVNMKEQFMVLLWVGPVA